MIASPRTLPQHAAGAATERFDPISALGSRDRHRADAVTPGAPGRYIQLQGPDRSLLIPLDDEVLHLGRGLSADLHLDDSSVSRRHAIIVPGPAGTRVLDDRSLNGTFVNGRPVESAGLGHGDVVSIGRFELRYLQIEPERPGAAASGRPPA